jgi:branched-chain amino acid transport system substrate-binding protein
MEVVMRFVVRLRGWLALASVVLIAANCGSAAPAEGGGTKEPILLGLTVALTGPNAYSAEPMVNAFKYGVDQINAKGGVLGRPFKLDLVDSGTKPADAVAAAQKVIGENVLAIVGGVSSAGALAIAPDIAKSKTILLTTSSTQDILYDKLKNPWYFNFHSSNPDNAADVVAYAKDQGYKSIAMLVDATALGTSFATAMRPVIAANGLTTAAVEQIDVSDNDVSSQVTKILASKPDMIASQLYGGESGLLIRELKKREGPRPPLVLGIAALYGAAGGIIPWTDLAGVYVLADNASFAMQNAPAGWAAWRTHVDTEKAKAFDGTAQSYDGLLVLANAIQQAGSTDQQKVQEKIAATKAFSGYNGIPTVASSSYTCDEQHQCWHGEVIVKVNGAFDVTVVATYSR